MMPKWPDGLELPSLAPIPENPAVIVQPYGKGAVIQTKWCVYHNAQIVNLVKGTCWDKERLHPCKPGDALVFLAGA